MCIAILKIAGTPINEDYLWNGWKNNDDGAGFAYVNENNEIITHHAMSWFGFKEEYDKAVLTYGDVSHFLIHFRITSRGNTTLANCHPFMVGDDMAIIHNGTITNIAIDKDDTRSDTAVFAQDWLTQMPKDWYKNEVINLMVETFIGFGSKVIMLHAVDGYHIFNESKGVWHEGNWFSNTSYEERKAYTYQGTYKKADTYYTKHDVTVYDKRLEDWNYTRCDRCNSIELWAELDAIPRSGTTLSDYVCSDCYSKYLALQDAVKDIDEDCVAEYELCDYCYDTFEDGGRISSYHVQERNEVMNLCEECLDLFLLSGVTLYDIDNDYKEVKREEITYSAVQNG